MWWSLMENDIDNEKKPRDPKKGNIDIEGKRKEGYLRPRRWGNEIQLEEWVLLLLIKYLNYYSAAKDSKVIPDPIDDRKFQEWKQSGKPRENVRRIPINVETKW